MFNRLHFVWLCLLWYPLVSCQFAVVPFGVLPICCGPVWCPANLLWVRLMSCQFAVVPLDVLPICCGPVWCAANLLWSRLQNSTISFDGMMRHKQYDAPDLRACLALHIIMHMLIYFVSLLTSSEELYFRLLMFCCTWSMAMMIHTMPLDDAKKILNRLFSALLRLFPHQQKRRMRFVVHSPHFGGRGFFIHYIRRKRRKRSIFDATLGYPGEGPGETG